MSKPLFFLVCCFHCYDETIACLFISCSLARTAIRQPSLLCKSVMVYFVGRQLQLPRCGDVTTLPARQFCRKSTMHLANLTS